MGTCFVQLHCPSSNPTSAIRSMVGSLPLLGSLATVPSNNRANVPGQL